MLAPLLYSFLAATAAVRAASSDVWELTGKDFDKRVDPEDLMLVEFFAPWCGHCKALAPHYEEAATTLKSTSDGKIKLAKVDCVAEADLCSRFGVGGYPTLKVFRKGEYVDYSGPRKADGIVSYMKKQALPPVSTLDASSHEEFTKSEPVVIVLYTSPTTSSSLTDAYTALAQTHREDFLFGTSSESSVLSSANVAAPALVLYKQFDENRDDLPDTLLAELSEGGDAGRDKVSDWVRENAMPVLDQISPENFAKYADAGLPIAYAFVEAGDDATVAKVLKEVEPVAKEFKGKVSFVWIDAVKFADHAKSLNLGTSSWPAFAIQDLASGSKFPFASTGAGALTTKALQPFVASYVSGELKPSIKSQPVPADPKADGPVTVLVADSFDDEVYSKGKDKDMLVEFYAPWCGHCKKLAPTYDSLAEKYAGVSDKLVIAKMDATENDIPPSAGFRVTGFPTIKFKKAGTDAFVDYVGGRGLDDFVEYLAREAGNDIGAPNETVAGGGEADQVVLGKDKRDEL